MLARKQLTKIMLVAVLLGVVGLIAPPASADMAYFPYFYFDYGSLSLDYTRNATAANPGAVIGSFRISDDGNSFLASEKWNYGSDGLLNGPGVGDDVWMDDVGFSNSLGVGFGLSFDAQVIYLGPNRYRVVTTSAGLVGADSITNRYAASFVSSSMDWDGSEFTMSGGLGPLGGNDSLLLGLGTDWVFQNSLGSSMGLSGAAGENRTFYGAGRLVEVHVDFSDGTGLDDFFLIGGGESRTSAGADMKVTIIPAPGAALLGVLGLGLVAWLRRRVS